MESDKPNQLFQDLLSKSMRGICFFGTSFIMWFLEVCAGTARLTTAIRMAGLTTMDPVDKTMGWDLTVDKQVRKLMDEITKWRPLLTHLSPNCRIFSIAFHPLRPWHEVEADPDYQHDMRLAINVCRIAEHIYRLQLFLCVETPKGSSMYSLTCYVQLA